MQLNKTGSPVNGTTYNPFVEIAPLYRHAIVIYFVFWRYLPDLILTLRSEAGSTTVLGVTLMAQFALTTLALLPFIVKSFGGLPMGWLNPLALASVLEIVKITIKSPLHILEPFMIWYREPVRLQHELLTHWSLEGVQWVEFKVLAMTLLGSLIYLFSFYFVRFKGPGKRQTVRSVPDLYFLAIYGVLFAAFLFLISLSGSIQSHFYGLSQGRFGVRENTGLLLVGIGFMPFLMVTWYLLRPSILRNPIFLGLLALALVLQFVSDGSRSSVLIPLVILTAGWIFRQRKVPAVTGLFALVFAITALAALGSVRKDASQTEGDVEFAALLSFDTAQFLRKNDEEIAGRNWRSGPVAVAAEVPRKRGYLFGETYLGAVTFWIPRSIWEEKPRGVGAYANALLFLNRKDVQGFQGAAYPVSGSAEAYWNFGWPGIIIMFALFGALHKFVATRVCQRPHDTEFVALLLLVTIVLNSPATDSIVPFLQMFVMLKLTFLGLRIITKQDGLPGKLEPQSAQNL